jgi:hypothetical protein
VRIQVTRFSADRHVHDAIGVALIDAGLATTTAG